jgi:mono/diheme cytochrome c family protein
LKLLPLFAGILLLSPAAVTWSQPDAAAGKAVYERLCASCHGPDGRGGRMAGMLPVPPRNLADAAYMLGRSTEHLFTIIKDGSAAAGLSDAMPGFGSQLDDQDIRNTVAYVQTLAQAQPSATMPTEIDTPAAEQPVDLRITRFQLSIWPEYDDPRVLLIVRGELAPGVVLPTRITLPIPQDAELIGAGMISELGELLLHPHRVLPGDASDMLEITLPSPRFFAELYYDPFETSGNTKRFSYTFDAPYPIGQLDVDIQQPYTASDFATEPPAMAQESEGRDTTYHRFAYRDVPAGQPTTFAVSYVKTDPQPSVPKADDAPAAGDAPSGPQDRKLLYFGILAGVAAMYILATLTWTAYRRRRPAVAAPEPQPAPLASPPVPPPVAPAAANFCSQCGRPLNADYAFCPSCGHAVRAS